MTRTFLGTRRAMKLVVRASRARREPCPVSDLVVGVRETAISRFAPTI